MTEKHTYFQIHGAGTAEELRARVVAAYADPTTADVVDDTPSANSPDAPWCGDCGSDVRWFTVEQQGRRLVNEPVKRKRLREAVAIFRESVGSAGRVWIKECKACGANLLVGIGNYDPATGRGVDPATGKP